MRIHFKNLVSIFLVLCCTSLSAAPDGLTYKQYSPDNHNKVHVLTVDPAKVKIIAARSHELGTGLDSVANIAHHHNAVAAINGGFFKFENNESGVGLPAGVLKINSHWYGIAYKPRGAIGWDPKTQQVLLDRLQTKSTVKVGEQVKPVHKLTAVKNGDAILQVSVLPQLKPKLAASWDKFPYIVGGGPLLILDNKLLQDYSMETTSSAFVNNKHARTAIGILPNKLWVLVIVEQQLLTDDTGMTIPELAEFMSTLGCIHALNLDGGSSTSMYLDPQIADNTNFIQRPVADAILVLAR
jgi:exopolysaccharide biosynthesis protein